MSGTRNSRRQHVIVIAPEWPSVTGGYGIAMRASLLLYTECFSKVYFLCISEKPFQNASEWTDFKVEWIHAPIVRSPIWVRFIRSLGSRLPAITVRYLSARRHVLQNVREIMQTDPENGHIIFEDIPTACFLSDIRREFPETPVAVRSHDMTVKAYGPLSHVGSPIHRLSWRYETVRIARFEKWVCEAADAFWPISHDDVKEYEKRLSVRASGVVGVCMDVDRYKRVPTGDIQTVVNIGTADLRKGNSLAEFIRTVWPEVRASVPQARLVLAGRGTERFTDSDKGVKGLGFVNDDRDVLGEGLIFVNPQTIAAGVQLKSIVAMLAGKTLVSTRVCAEGVEGRDGEHFLVSEPGKQMAEAVISLMQDPQRASAMGRKARELAVETYNKEHFIEESKPVVDSFAGNRHRR